MKLKSLDNNINTKFIKTNDTKVLFYQKNTSQFLYVNYYDIWSVLESEYNIKYGEIIIEIKMLLFNKKLKKLTPMLSSEMPMNNYYNDLLNSDKIKQI